MTNENESVEYLQDARIEKLWNHYKVKRLETMGHLWNQAESKQSFITGVLAALNTTKQQDNG